MEFLIDITVRVPPTLPADELAALMSAERQRGHELLEAGVIRHIWRVPGALRNVAIWSAQDATELHALLTSLPVHRYCEVSVMPLAVHPLQGGPEGGTART